MKTVQVRAAIADCDQWYAAHSRNIRTLTESINAFWIEVDFHIARMELAEAAGMEKNVNYHLDRILNYLARIHAQAQEERD